jgi:hypothetical protein
LGANLDPLRAARAAALEVGQVRPAFRERCRTHDVARIAELVANPEKVKSLEDHALLYADPTMAHEFEFLMGRRQTGPRLLSRARPRRRSRPSSIIFARRNRTCFT